MSPTKYTLFTFRSYKGAYGPAVLPGNLLFKLTLAGCQRKQLYENLTYGLRGYRVKLQRWEYTEWCTPENNPNSTHYSVGLAHARPNNGNTEKQTQNRVFTKNKYM